MKNGTILINTFLAAFLAVSQNLFFSTGSNQAKAQGTTKPYVVFVNGQSNCCAWGMNDLQNRLISLYGLTRNDLRYVPYSNFGDGGQSGGGNQYDWTSVDSRFLKDGQNFINNVLDRNRPLILIGHSYGGDSILKLLPRLNRRVQFVAVIDPVARGGWRHPINGYTVPGNVDYFFNRWQENEPWPIDFKVNGSVLCNASQCDQKSQFAHTSVDGKPNRESCKWYETCKNKQVRTGHQSLPTDDFIEKVIAEKIEQQIPTVSAMFPQGGVYFTDRSTTFFSQDGSWHCAFATPGQYIIHQGAYPVRANAGIQSPGKYGRFIGTCGVPPVYFGRKDGATFFSENGETHCVFQSPQDYRVHQARNRTRTVLNLGLQEANRFGPFTGACAVQ